MRDSRSAYRVLMGIPLGRPRRRWEENIKMYLQEEGWGGVDWIAVAQDRERWRGIS
jgi:hypothetical protein